MITKQEVENKYSELQKTLVKAYSELEAIEADNEELKELQGDLVETLKAQIQQIREESENSLNAIAWDRLVIAFFGETNAGKSTIIETFRILFDKKRPKDKDGEIVGDGRSDFTKDYNEYDMNIDGRPFTLIDVPGIEGNEAEFKDIIKEALGKAHCVFYVQGHNKKPDAETAKKIKNYLGDWVNVYSIQNIRGGVSNYDQAEERETLLTESVRKNEGLIEEEFKTILGDVYKGNIPLQALLAMCAKAKFSEVRKDLQKKQAKLMGFFGSADDILRFSQFQTIVNLVKDKSSNFTEEIAESNKQKLISLARKAYREIEQAWDKNEDDTEALRRQLKNFRREANTIIGTCEGNMRSNARNEVNRQYGNLKSNLYNIINRNDNAKYRAAQQTDEFGGKLQRGITSVINKEIQHAKEKIELKKKTLEGIGTLGGCNFVISSTIDGDIDVDDAIGELDINLDDVGDFFAGTVGLAATGAAIGSVVPGVGTVAGAIAGGVVGFGATVIKKATGDHGKGSAKNMVSQSLEESKAEVMPKVMRQVDKTVRSLDQYNKAIKQAVGEELKRLDRMDELTEKIKQQLQIYVNKIKITEYGTV